MLNQAVPLQLLYRGTKRLAQTLCHAGFTHPADALRAIQNGEVKVDGIVIRNNITVHDDAQITFQGFDVPVHCPAVIYAVRKPKGIKCSMLPLQGVKTLNDYIKERSRLHEHLDGRIPIYTPSYLTIVNRLGFMSEGLVVLTNDAQFAERLRSLAANILTTYRLKVFGRLPADFLQRLNRGVTVDNVDYGPVSVEPLKRNYTTGWLRIHFVETAERSLPMLMDAYRLKILRSERTAFGAITLSHLPPEEHVSRVPIPPAFRPFLPSCASRFSLVPAKDGDTKLEKVNVQ